VTHKVEDMTDENSNFGEPESTESAIDFEPEIEEDKITAPFPTDKEWSDYVLSKFTEDEMFNGSPTVDGLRRVAELLLGEIIRQDTQVIQSPSQPDNRATVVHTIDFLLDVNDKGVISCKSFSGAADSYWGNTDKVFNKYPVAMAETRAECRALRRALKLKTVSAEEISKIAEQEDALPTNEQNLETSKITNNQINFLEILVRNDQRGLDIDLQKFVQIKYPKINNIKELLHSQSLILQKELSELQQDKTKIPDEIKGYKPDWKESFYI